jgi:hypothetical protein
VLESVDDSDRLKFTRLAPLSMLQP